MQEIAKSIHYSGRVQGVGFRYTTLQIAQEYQVVGWVHNLADGRVEVQVKGSKLAVDDFLNHIRNHSRLSDYIRTIDESSIDSDALENFDTFSIRR